MHSTAKIHRPPADSPPADPLSAEERVILERLERDDPAGSVEADPEDWPAWTDFWHWHPSGRPGRLEVAR